MPRLAGRGADPGRSSSRRRSASSQSPSLRLPCQRCGVFIVLDVAVTPVGPQPLQIRAAESVDELQVIGQHHQPSRTDAPDERILQPACVLVLIGDHRRVARRVGARDRRVPLEHAPEQRAEVVGVPPGFPDT